ncbi:uncharacterized protein TRIADDRAFT_52584 [Trichoplax adhaerens]|uniref:DNA replication regulator SLD2 n=1 Tax=Trichoplax adhaerens TaxID=10228 RepID=B3RJ63_TRIAD|nr:predicted protein [Trichoplax adhaerens]EDV29804.1 predicted protein [Trichoplax adhaerens]|eukprot:XP_002109006.1 predicted protein [Trichoplax adhaerens]
MEVGTLRKQLKDWERQFYKEKGKKPSKLSGLETNTDIKCKGFKIVSAAPKSTPSAVTKRFLSLSQRNPKASSFEQHSTWPDIVIPPWAMSTAENNSKDLHSDSTKTLDIPAISPPPPQGSLTIQKGDWNNGKLAETNDREVPCDSNKRSISDSTFNATQEKETTTKIKKMKTPKYPESTSRKFGGYQSYSRKNNEKTISKSKILEYPSIVEDDLISNNNIDSENSVKAEKEENSRESE